MKLQDVLFSVLVAMNLRLATDPTQTNYDQERIDKTHHNHCNDLTYNKENFPLYIKTLITINQLRLKVLNRFQPDFITSTSHFTCLDRQLRKVQRDWRRRGGKAADWWIDN